MFEETVEQRLRPIAAAFAESDLVRIRIADERTEIELRRAAPKRSVAAPAGRPHAPAATSETLAAGLVGVVHLLVPRPAEGTIVQADHELAYVEALGIRNSVRAGAGGRIACVYVDDGQPVDYGQPLFVIER
jgi:acetyl-CoA carboxylase biotin carboxyl carrier protein